MRILLPTFTKQSKTIIQSLIFVGVLLILTWSCRKEDPPTLTTLTVTEITGNTAQSGGNITDDGSASVTARGIVWSTSENPTMNNKEGSTSDGTGDGQFVSNLTGLSPGTTYFIRAYAVNSTATAYGNQEQFTTVDLASVTTADVTEITARTATSGGNLTGDGGAEVTARGVVWGPSEIPTIESYIGKTTDGTGTGSFISELTELNPGTTYYIRAYATNLEGTSYGEQVSFITLAESGGDETEIVEVTNPATGRTWMDRNLGASRAATSSTDEEAYGDLFQWGRDKDGHEKRISGTTADLSNSDTPGHGDFITNGSSFYDWRSPRNDNLWQGVNSINNPCPAGYRLPTEDEWNAERTSWSSNDATGAFASPLKLTVAGYRYFSNGVLYVVGSYGLYWSSNVDGTYSRYLSFNSSAANMMGDPRAGGRSVRCIKD